MTHPDDLPWQGRGGVRVAEAFGWWWLRYPLLSTRGGRLKNGTHEAFRDAGIALRPRFEPFEVRIWIAQPDPSNRVDVDNVAKACLDSLIGLLWRDDRQVVRLLVEKRAEAPPGVLLAARVTEPPGPPRLPPD